MSPIDENVAAILRATMPLLPTPVIELRFAIGTTLEQGEGGFHLLAAQPFCGGCDRRGFLLKAASESGQG